MARQLRIARGFLLGMSLLLLTAVAHSVAHGQLPQAQAFLALTPVSVGLSVIAMERQRGTLWFLLYSLGTQALLHVLLVSTTAHAAHQTPFLPDATMASAHVLAAMLLAIVLAHADALLIRWVSYMRSAVFGAFLTVPLITSRAQGAREVDSVFDYQCVLGHSIARRGPPASRQ